ELVVVGVNRYRDDGAGEAKAALQRIDPEGERRQVERLRRVRAERNASAWTEAIGRLEATARGSDNLVPVMIDAVKAGATVGEISDALRTAFGVHRELITI
ncbi:MAG TPA: methylmalonyl-CoA mutase family protein, partial [Candidatus Limnocylindrales bacterium]|nr:methylmalonyl-CoA mutase family protein [Candidatus Limnocylindrales bacterium]